MSELQRILLGPQRPTINLGRVREVALPEGPMAVISAGWQEAEADIDEVYEQVQSPLLDLKLYQRAEQVFSEDPNLHKAYRQRQDRLQELQQLYRMRLRQLMTAARRIRRAKAARDLVEAELQHAVAQLRELDQHHLGRIATVYDEFADALGPNSSGLLADHIAEINTILEDCDSVLITGGNVLVLLNRLQLFDLKAQLAKRHLVAWSAGAMVLSDLIVLYHDRTPLGRRDVEVLGPGMGILHDKIFLPDARKRLLEKDVSRISVLHERFSPADCITLNSGSFLRLYDNIIQTAEQVGYLGESGRVQGLSPG